MTPFRAIYGRDPLTFLKLTNEPSVVEEVNEQIRSRNAIIATLKENLIKAQEEMRKQANKHRRDVQFEVGEQVHVGIQPYRLRTLAKRVNGKLSPLFYGPYKIVERVGAVAYHLDLPPIARIHPVFHISVLKKSMHSGIVTPTIPPALSEQLELQVQPEEVCRVRKLISRQLEVLIKWKDMPAYENSWEDAEAIATQFPGFHLEDKVKLLGEGTERTLFDGKTYARKPRKTQTTQAKGKDAF